MAKKIVGVDEPDGYVVSYECINPRTQRHQKVKVCTVFSSYNDADAFLCEELSRIEESGGTHFGGDVSEYYSPY